MEFLSVIELKLQQPQKQYSFKFVIESGIVIELKLRQL